jgi:hypothetical protein
MLGFLQFCLEALGTFEYPKPGYPKHNDYGNKEHKYVYEPHTGKVAISRAIHLDKYGQDKDLMKPPRPGEPKKDRAGIPFHHVTVAKNAGLPDYGPGYDKLHKGMISIHNKTKEVHWSPYHELPHPNIIRQFHKQFPGTQTWSHTVNEPDEPRSSSHDN